MHSDEYNSKANKCESVDSYDYMGKHKKNVKMWILIVTTFKQRKM